MHIYIANGTAQTHKFMYRLPEKPGEFQLDIPPGGQVRLPHDMSIPELDSVIEQHKRYGLVEAKANQRFDRRTAPLCYSIGKPVVLDSIHALILANREVLTTQGKKMREEAGVAIHAQMEEMVVRNQMPDRLVQAEISVQEDSQEPEFAEGVKVSRDNPAGQPARPKLSRRRQRSE